MDEFEINPGEEKLLQKIAQLNETAAIKVDIASIEKAIYYAKKYHGEQMRDCGVLPYYTHPIAVAYMTADYIFKTDIIVASILHDTIEDTDLTKDLIAAEFGKLIAEHVEDLTRVKKDDKISSAEMLESLRLQEKYDLVLIKEVDRLHNIMTLGVKSQGKRTKAIRETLTYFIPVAAYLGEWGLEQELTKHCIKIKAISVNLSNAKDSRILGY